jgi:hypothetical protein
VSDEQWKTKFEDMYRQPSPQVPFYGVLGNHDYRSNPQARVDYTATSTRWRMPDRYYTFSYNIDDTTRVQFFCLDTNPMSKGATEELGDVTEFSNTTQQMNRIVEKQLIKSGKLKPLVSAVGTVTTAATSVPGVSTILEKGLKLFGIDLNAEYTADDAIIGMVLGSTLIAELKTMIDEIEEVENESDNERDARDD